MASPEKRKNVPLIPAMGSALVTLSVMSEGKKVGGMERLGRTDSTDSGWVIWALGDTQEYLDIEENSKVVDLNVVANVDPSIVRFLSYPEETLVERYSEDEPLEIIEGPEEEPHVIHLIAVEGECKLTRHWAANLGNRYYRRFDGDSLVLSRKGITIWVAGYEGSTDVDTRLAEIQDEADGRATDHKTEKFEGWARHSYLMEADDQLSLCGFACTPEHELIVEIYVDDDAGMEEAVRVFEALQPA